MPYRLVTCLFLFCTFYTSMAQYTIRRIDKTMILARVLEEKNATIYFKKQSDSLERIYTLHVNDVECIRYQNGTIKYYTKPFTDQVYATEVKPIQNLLLLRSADLVFAAISIAYKRFTHSQKFRWRIPLSFSVRSNPTHQDSCCLLFYPSSKTFSTGLELSFYIGSPSKFRYYIGPAMQVGFSKFSEYSYPSYSYDVIRAARQITLFLINGFWYQAKKSIVIVADYGIGWRTRSFSANEYYSRSGLLLPGNISRGFQF